MFVEKLKLSRIAAVPQEHWHPRLILNLSARPDKDMPSSNYTTNREAALELLQFGGGLPSHPSGGLGGGPGLGSGPGV